MPTEQAVCQVELFGPARLLAGIRAVELQLTPPLTLRGVVVALAAHCPSLIGPVLDLPRQQLASGHVFNRNGRDFLTQPDAPLESGDRILLLSSTAGG